MRESLTAVMSVERNRSFVVDFIQEYIGQDITETISVDNMEDKDINSINSVLRFKQDLMNECPEQYQLMMKENRHESKE
jgi:hypothetical protein